MGALKSNVYVLLIIMMCKMEMAYTSTAGGKEPFSGWLDEIQVQEDRFTRKSCQWVQGDKSVMCKGLYLGKVPVNLPPDTETLNLAYNNISILLNTSFEPYQNLVTLDLRRNNITTIQPAAFQSLNHLNSLNLSENYNLKIHSSVPFQPLQALVSLDMRKCNLEGLPNDLMDWFPHLQYLRLSDNLLSSLNVSQCKTDRLITVELSGNKFRDLYPDTFMFVCPTDKLTMIRNPVGKIWSDVIKALRVDTLWLELDLFPTPMLFIDLLSGVAMSTINTLILVDLDLRDGFPDGIFTLLERHPLDTMSIDSSGDLSLFENVFHGLPCLKLVLNGNSITEIEPKYFLGMSGLKELILLNNRIMYINPHNEIWEIDIECLNLSGNKIMFLYGYQLRGLNHLKLLNLSRNSHLEGLDLLSYDGFENLEIVDVTGTALTFLALSPSISIFHFADKLTDDPFIPGHTFSNTIKLEILDVRHSQLKIDDLWDTDNRRSLFGGLIHLLELYLSNNPLGNLPDKVFEDNSLLANLSLDNCKISSFTGNVFQGLDSLVYLDLNGNNLLLISTNELKYLPVLETLNVNDNLIMFIQEGAVEIVPFLRNLKLANNRLIAFNRSTWNTLMKYDLDNFDVSGNPLACLCNYDWLHNLANTSGMFVHQNETLCSVDSLSQLRVKPLFEFDPSKYCVPNIVLLSILPFVCLAFLIGVLLAYHNRWLMRYKLFLLKLAVIGYREMQDARGHEEFIYDLNIMFTEEDEAWAREHLRPTLEERLPDYNRYSFGDEDLTLGMHYLEAVHYAVDNSFKTILLLSRSAVRDNWFLIKLRTAMDHVHDKLIENTVVIFLEDIPEDEIPYLLRVFLSDRRPYMRWPEDIRGREYFWKVLTKVATVNLIYNPLIPPE